MQNPESRLFRYRKVVEGSILLMGMIGGGGGIGYYAGVQQMTQVLIQRRVDHNQEIQRLLRTQEIAIGALTNRVGNAAQTAQAASETAANAADTAQAAAQTAAKAAHKADVSTTPPGKKGAP